MYISSNDINDLIRWSRKTFGPTSREQGIIDHIKKELEEIESAAPGEDKLGEWIDIIILGIDGAWRSLDNGEVITREDEATPATKVIAKYLSKMKQNYEREWPRWQDADPDKAIEHVRGI